MKIEDKYLLWAIGIAGAYFIGKAIYNNIQAKKQLTKNEETINPIVTQ